MQPIVNRTASIGAQLHAGLREAIVRLELAPGVSLSEAEIAARYAVSRQPVREAFIRLAHEGLVEVRPQRGTFVKRISANEVLETRFVREAIEVAVAREAARLADDKGIARLREQVRRQGAARTNAEFLAADEAMHAEIARIAGRSAAWQIVHQIKAQMDRMRYLSYRVVSPVDRLLAQHGSIVEAIEAHDEDAAEAAVREHMAELLAQLPQLRALYPDLFED